ncbi:plasmid recombination protein, partial [Klebsiella oxytoca]
MYAICRVGKIKSQSQLSQAQSHNLRQRETFNADPLKTSNNEILYGSPFVRDDVNKRLEESGVKIRKDSVLCAE